MLNILIADDESLTRQGLVSYLDWKSIGIGNVASAENGLQALEEAKNCVPDILLTDIMMPHMDGIQLTEKIRELYPECRIILFSGHADKDYLKSAINLQVDAYIDKPIVAERVLEVVKKVAEEIERTRTRRIKETLLNHSFDATLYIIKSRIAQALITQETDWIAFRNNFEPAYFSYNSGDKFITCSIWINNNGDIYETRLNRLLNDRLITEGLAWNRFYLGEISKYRIACIFCNTDHAMIESILKKVIDGFSLIGLRAAAVVGEITETIEEISNTYWKADGYLDYISFYGKLAGCHNIGNITRNIMRFDLYRGEVIQVGDEIKILDDIYKERYSNTTDIRRQLFKIHAARNERSGKTIINWDEFSLLSLTEIRKELESNNENIINLHGYACFDAKVKKGIYYISKHYSDSTLSVGNIAEYVGLSPNYFATLFKQNSGITVNDYITSVRLERIKWLLKNTNKKLYEIGEEVGIPDANYLNTVFRRKLGISPTQYRKNG